MSNLIELRKDLARNQEEVRALRQRGAPSSEIAQHLAETVWPFLEAMLENVGEIDDAVDDLIQESDDLLQADTAAKISAPLILAGEFAKELEKRLQPAGANAADDGLRVKLKQFQSMFLDATNLIAEITIFDEDPNDDEEGDDEDDSDDEEG